MSKIHSVQTICKNAGRNSIEVTAFCSLYVYSEQYGDTLTGPVIELGQQMLQDDLWIRENIEKVGARTLI